MIYNFKHKLFALLTTVTFIHVSNKFLGKPLTTHYYYSLLKIYDVHSFIVLHGAEKQNILIIQY